MDGVKKCTKCGKELPLCQFNKKKFHSGNIGYRSECKDCQKAVNDNWRKFGREEKKVIAVNRMREWRKNNPGRVRMNATKYARERRVNDLNFKLISNIRAALSVALRNNIKYGHATELLGCSIEYLRNHLEGQFIKGMTWDNYGLCGWHIDHIIPVSYFDHSDPEQQKRAWHYTNLRPLWAADNLKKSNKIEEYQLMLL